MDLGFGMSVDPTNILITALQELCKRIGQAVLELEDQREELMIEKESLRQFSYYVSEMNMILEALKAKGLENSTESMATISTLQNLNSQLNQAFEVIEKYKSGSRLWLLLNFRSLLEQMEKSAKGVSETVSMLAMTNHDPNWSLKPKMEKLASNLRSLDFKPTATREATALEIEKLIAQKGRNMEYTNKLLERIMEAVGATTNAAILREELLLLRREKEQLKTQMKQAEALQLSQLIGFLSSLEMASSTAEASTSSSSVALTENGNRQATVANSSRRHDLIGSFKCPLSSKVMEDPVAILCGHSFERDAIRERFERGEKTCPVCQEKLTSVELTPNLSLRSTIHEWRQRDLDDKLRRAVLDIASEDPNRVSQALEDLKLLMEMPQYRAAITEQGLVPKIVSSLKAGRGIDTKAALKCLCYLADHSDENKKAIVEAGAIDYIQKLFRRGEAQPDAVALLLELSEKEEFVEKIGNTDYCIPFLVSVLQNHNPDISQKAAKVVENLSSNIHFVIKMAEAGYFQSFLARFSQAPLETQAWMATALVQMQLNEVKMKVFEHKQFVGSLVRALSSSAPAYRSACLQCIKKLSAYPTMAKWFLGEAATIPALLGLISFFSSDLQWRQVATEILTSLIEPTHLSEFEANPNLQELQSHHNIGVFLHFVTEDSTPETKTQFMRLLLAIGNKSEVARELIRSDKDAITRLFSSLNSNNTNVIRQTLKLIHCIANEHPDGVPLPPLPAREMAINALVMIFACSPEVEDRSIAAGIMSTLPLEDTTVDNILYRSEALKAIREVICTADSMHLAPTTVELLLENALAVLLRYAEPSKPMLRKQMSDLELYPSLVRVLTNGSSRAKQHTATVLAHLSQPTMKLATESDSVTGASDKEKSLKPWMFLAKLLPMSSLCCNSASLSPWSSWCSVHGSACSSRYTFCLVKSNAVRPLLRTLSEKEAAESALLALEMLLKDQSTLSCAASTIADNQGVAAILEVLEKGSLPAKEKALDLFQIISQHTSISRQQSLKSERILIQLLQDETLKKKAASMLSEMDVISKQSSFF